MRRVTNIIYRPGGIKELRSVFWRKCGGHWPVEQLATRSTTLYATEDRTIIRFVLPEINSRFELDSDPLRLCGFSWKVYVRFELNASDEILNMLKINWIKRDKYLTELIWTIWSIINSSDLFGAQ